MYIQVIDDPKNRKIFLVQELMEGGALMPDSEKCDAMTNEVRESWLKSKWKRIFNLFPWFYSIGLRTLHSNQWFSIVGALQQFSLSTTLLLFSSVLRTLSSTFFVSLSSALSTSVSTIPPFLSLPPSPLSYSMRSLRLSVSVNFLISFFSFPSHVHKILFSFFSIVIVIIIVTNEGRLVIF